MYDSCAEWCTGSLNSSTALLPFSNGQEMVSVFFAIKLKNFVVILIFIR